jgi:Zn-finger in ubiquitin-hydrolases and other protein
MAGCTHAAHVVLRQLPAAVDGCEDCLATGGKWLHLRICLECGHVGCCDSSPARHATGHARHRGHPIIRSIEPGEQWAWCYVDEVALETPQVTGETRIPASPLAS